MNHHAPMTSFRYASLAALLTFVVHGTPLSGNGIFLADPSVCFSNGRYYLIGTESSAAVPKGKVLSGKFVFPQYVSSDLKHWRFADTPLGEGRLLAKTEAVGTSCFWAPQLFTRDGRWYFAYTCDMHLGIAVGDRPEGPFKRYAEFPKANGRIDPFVLQDADGRLYAYFSCSKVGGLAGVELTKDMKAFVGEPVRCVANDRPWERRALEPSFTKLNAEFKYTGHSAYMDSSCTIEGPTVLRRGGKYVLFYSANDYRSPDYCVGCAVADGPLGPWKKLQDGPVLSRAETHLNGTGHGDIFTDTDGRLWYVFHAHHSPTRIHPRRTGAIRLVETIGSDGYPRYTADMLTLKMFETAIEP